MTNSINSSRDFNELLFENKNKAYGAYALRTAHSTTMAKSMFITFSAVCILVAAAFMMNRKNMESKSGIIDIDSLQITTCYFDKPPVEVEQPVIDKPKTKETSAYSDDLNLKVVDKPVDDAPKPNEILVLKNDGDTKGKIDSAEHVEVPEVIADPPREPNEIVYAADEMPAFDGNIYKYIKEHLIYPQIAVENGTQGIVGLSFIIEKDGSIGDIKVLNSVPDGCTQEAIRVIKSMPRWKPGKNKGVPVRVMFNVPIKFKLQ